MRVSMLIMSDCPAAIEGAHAALAAWYRSAAALDTVFMYHKAAYAPLNLNAAALADWAHLAHASGVRLLVCRSALQRRGQVRTAGPFILGGLADWVQASLRSDVRRCVGAW